MASFDNLINNPILLIKPIVKNNPQAVGENMQQYQIAGLTEVGLVNLLTQMWKNGKEDEVWGILTVPYIPENTTPPITALMDTYGGDSGTITEAVDFALADLIEKQTPKTETKPQPSTGINGKPEKLEVATLIVLLLMVTIGIFNGR